LFLFTQGPLLIGGDVAAGMGGDLPGGDIDLLINGIRKSYFRWAMM